MDHCDYKISIGSTYLLQFVKIVSVSLLLPTWVVYRSLGWRLKNTQTTAACKKTNIFIRIHHFIWHPAIVCAYARHKWAV